MWYWSWWWQTSWPNFPYICICIFSLPRFLIFLPKLSEDLLFYSCICICICVYICVYICVCIFIVIISHHWCDIEASWSWPTSWPDFSCQFFSRSNHHCWHVLPISSSYHSNLHYLHFYLHTSSSCGLASKTRLLKKQARKLGRCDSNLQNLKTLPTQRPG